MRTAIATAPASWPGRFFYGRESPPPSIAARSAIPTPPRPGRGRHRHGLSAALGEEITIDSGAVVQRSFPDYPILTLAQTPPRIDVHLVPSGRPWGGLGEPGLPPVAPALANALFAATGCRLRTLPLATAARRMAAG